MRVLDLFSGIGGFSLGLEAAGMETVAFCEIDTFCQKVLEKHWPDVPIFNDVRNLYYEGSVDVICGGYPCQPFSFAGKRKGQDDDRHLWPAMFNLVKKYRPSWVIGENVAGHFSMGLDQVLFDLESEGYSATTFIIPACAINAPHRRDRLWIIANRPSESGATSSKRENSSPEEGKLRGMGSKTDILSNSNSWRQSGSGEYEQSVNTEKGENRKAISSFTSCGQEQWAVEPELGRVANGIPDRMDRLKCLGNAVVPQIPYQIGLAIMEIENAKL